jgi:hypothetical protein
MAMLQGYDLNSNDHDQRATAAKSALKPQERRQTS